MVSARLYDLLTVNGLRPELRLRTQYEQAYRILSNVERRRTYDAMGERIVAHLLLFDSGKLLRCAIGPVWLIFSILMTTFLALLPLKTDHVKGPSWPAVFAPVTVLAILAVICSIAIVIIQRSTMNPSKAIFAFVTVLYFVFVVSLQATLTARRRWGACAVLPLIAELAATTEWACVRRRPHVITQAILPTGTGERALQEICKEPIGTGEAHLPETPRLAYACVILAGCDAILTVLKYGLIFYQVNSGSGNWYLVLIPFWLHFLVNFLIKIVEILILIRIEELSKLLGFVSCVSSAIFNGLLITSTFLVAERLNWHYLRLDYALIPLYIIMAYYIVASLYTIVYMYLS